MGDTWYNEVCPTCKKLNWVCLGDLNDFTLPSIEGYKCYFCSKINIFEDINPDDLSDPDDPYIDDGLEHPR